MKNSKITLAKLHGPNHLFLENGRWKANGHFVVDEKAVGDFRFNFINQYNEEFFLSMQLSENKYIENTRFNKNQVEYKKQILDFILPGIEKQIQEIRSIEAYMVKPQVQITAIKKADSFYKVKFIIGLEEEKEIWVKRGSTGEWEFDISFASYLTKTIDFSSWLSYIWEHVKEHEELKLPLLF